MNIPKVNRDFVNHTKNITFKSSQKQIRISIAFKNIGTTEAKINGFPLSPGDGMLTFTTDLVSEDVTQYLLSFQDNAAAGNNVFVIDSYIENILPQISKEKCR